MAKERTEGSNTSGVSGVVTELDGHQKRLSGLLAKETDSMKKNAIVQQRSAIKQAMSLLGNVTL